MAQHDYVIDNQAFPATRADINSVLQAIVTNNSGSSAPSTTFANQIWYDSSANIIYIRNEDNDANIPLFNLDQSNDVASLLATIIDIADASGTNQAGTALTIQGGAGTGSGAAGKIFLKTAPAGSSGSSVNSHATQMTIGGSGVGIGVEAPAAQLHIQGDDTSNQVIIENTSDSASNAPDLLLKRNSSSPADGDEVGQIVFQGKNDNNQFPSLAQIRVIYDDVTDTTEDATMAFRLMSNGSNSEVMRISGDTLLIGKTASDFDGGIFEAGSGGTFVSRSGTPFAVNRNSSNGQLVNFYKDGSSAGSIGSLFGNTLYVSSSQAGGLRFTFSSSNPLILPCDTTGGSIDNSADLGSSSVRFRDVYSAGGVTTSSDQNEKQQIASLTDAEIAAAKRISAGFKTFKWNDAVAEKGDSARTHAGVIAQQVRTSLEAEGLDAGDYAFFMSNTWWEHEVEVPAVEAREAVYDDDGNLVTEAIESIDAVKAHTRRDVYYTADEAPEGATERTRLGIRYAELMAFIGAATEQRLTSIEARLTALEG